MGQQSAGLLHEDGFEFSAHKIKKTILKDGLFGGRYMTRTYDLPHVKRML